MKLKSGHEVTPISKDEEEELKKDFPLVKYGVTRFQPSGWICNNFYLKYADILFNYKFRKTDVIVTSFPKCGSTWMQEIVWTLVTNLNFDNPEALESGIVRIPLLELDAFSHFPFNNIWSMSNPMTNYFVRRCRWEYFFMSRIMLEIIESRTDPRTIKTHLPLSFLPPNLLDQCKVIYIARNPYDVCVSYFHHNRVMKFLNYVGTWDKFVDYFTRDLVIYGPFWQSMEEAWQRRNHPNMLFCFYEEIKKNPRKNIEKLSKFLDIKITEKQIDQVLDYTSFEKMKMRDAFWGTPGRTPFIMFDDRTQKEGGFFRKGEVGDWEGKFTQKQKDKMDKWIKDNLTKRKFGPEFPYYKDYFAQKD